MARSLWKQEEITDREAEFLRIARRLLVEHGIQGLTMDRLAAATPYSKGTVYQHFASREDILGALCVQIGELRLDVLERASRFKGTSRERAVAAQKGHSLLFQLHRDLWIAEELIRQTHLRAKLTAERRAAYDGISGKNFGVYIGIIRDGMASGELTPPDSLTAEQLMIGAMATAHGLYSVWASDSPVQSWVNDSTDVHFKLMSALYDGFGWRPFASEWDYAETVRRIWAEVYPAEYARAKAASG